MIIVDSRFQRAIDIVSGIVFGIVESPLQVAMLQASGAIKSCYISRNFFGSKGFVGINFFRIGVEIVVAVSARNRFVFGRNLLVARSGIVSVKLCSRLCMRHKLEIARFFCEHIAEGFYHAALFSRESAFAATYIAALQGNKHGLVDIAVIVGFHKNIRSHGSAHAIFGHAVEIIVPNVHGHGAYARMSAVAVVEPVMMIRDEVFAAFAGHAAKGHFARIPKMIVGKGHELRIAFTIERAVALGLVGIAACLSVEKVDVMHPAMAIVAVDGNAVVHEIEDA